MTNSTASRTVALALTLFLCGTASRCQADLVFNLQVDTSSVAGTQGYLDLQFNPIGGDQDITATVTSLTGPTMVDSFTTAFGSVQGTGVPLVFTADPTQSGSINEAFAAITFGNSVDMTVDITTPDNMSTASFQVTLYDQYQNAILNSDPTNPSVIELNLMANPGGTVPTVMSVPNGGSATLAPSVPEPSAALLGVEALGCLVLLTIARRKHAATAA